MVNDFWHRLCLHFGTHLASNLIFVRNRFCDDFGDDILIDLYQNNCHVVPGDAIFLATFPHLDHSCSSRYVLGRPLAPFSFTFGVFGTFSAPLWHRKSSFSAPESVKHP